MNEKHLLSQLNNLKNIKPDNSWKQESREILLSQISAVDYSSDLSGQKFSISDYFRNFLHQPALVVSAILLVVLGGGIFSVGASRDAKPGDSLYIAKIISEKARSTFAFNEEEKARLGIEFAGNRAKEITQVLAGHEDSDKEAKVEKLTRNFQREINSVKTRLKNININKEDLSAVSATSAGSGQAGEDAGEADNTEEDIQMFSANLGKDDKGMQIYIQEKNNGSEDTGAEDAESPEDIIITTPEARVGASSTVSVSGDVKTALEEAEKLFAEQDYDGTLNKLEEAMGQISDNDDVSVPEGEVKGESETVSPDGGQGGSATTTGEVLTQESDKTSTE